MPRTKGLKGSSQRYVYGYLQSNMLPTIAIPQVTNEKITLSVDSSKELELPERLRLCVGFPRMLVMD